MKAIILALVLCSCNTDVYPKDVEKLKEFCKEHGGGAYINTFGSVLWAHCKDGVQARGKVFRGITDGT